MKPQSVSEALDRVIREPWRMERAIDRGVRKAAEFHRRMDVPMVGWEDGRVVQYDPAELIEELDRKLAGYPQDDDAVDCDGEATGPGADKVMHDEV